MREVRAERRRVVSQQTIRQAVADSEMVLLPLRVRLDGSPPRPQGMRHQLMTVANAKQRHLDRHRLADPAAVISLHGRRSVTISHEPVITAMVWLSGAGSGSSSNTRTAELRCHGASSVRNQAADRHGRRISSGGVPVWTRRIGYVSPFSSLFHVHRKHYAAGKTAGQITNYYNDAPAE
jgi:hypothetical protein